MSKLAWFNVALLSAHGTGEFNKQHGSNYFWGGSIPPSYPNTATLWHTSMMMLTGRSICMVDQTGISKKYGDGLDMARTFSSLDYMPKPGNPERGKLVDASFNDAVAKRVDDMYDQAEQHGYDEIRISWSGGIDSNFVIAAIMQHPRSKTWIDNNRISVYTTRFARREDIVMWDWLMASGLPVRYIDYEELVKDTSNWMLVTGEGEPYGTMFSTLHINHVDRSQWQWGHWSIMEKYFLHKDPTGLCWEYFQELMTSSPIPIETCYHAWWYFENSVESQCYLYRLAAYSTEPIIDPAIVYPGKKTFWFLGCQDLANHGAYIVTNKLMPEESNLVKPHLRQYLADWMGWTEAKPKARFFSQNLIPKRVNKWRIYEDLSWDRETNLKEWL